jgi:DNA sulfur modification protein DndD
MKVNSLKLDNFGPYCGTHEVDLSTSAAAPVIVIHGENGRGKTSLLNAIRWCLYGSAGDPRKKKKPTFRSLSYDALDQSQYYMSVTLEFDHDGLSYSLARHVQAERRPRRDSDLEEQVFLRKDGSFQPEGEVEEIIAGMLHPNVSRFFLFDGEMLDQYEVLLGRGGREAALVRDSIEQVLGLPALQLMAEDLGDLRSRAERESLAAASNARLNHELTEAAEAATAGRDALDEEIDRLVDQQAQASAKRDDLADELDRFAEIAADRRDLERLKLEKAELESERDRARDECKEILRQSWWIAVAASVKKRIEEIDLAVQTTSEDVEKASQLRQEQETLSSTLGGDVCSLCGADVTSATHQDLERRLDNVRQALEAIHGTPEDLATLIAEKRALAPFSEAAAANELQASEDRYRRAGIEIRKRQRQIDGIDERLRGHDLDAIARTQQEYEDWIRQLGRIEGDLEEKRIERAEKQRDIADTQRQISRLPGSDQRLVLRRALLEALGRTFEGGIDLFRDRLRNQVQQQAAEIFRSLITEQAFVDLKINDQYGLEIIDDEGREIPDRSMGQEQIVALSLIGGLNRASGKHAPIVMDTPFGRLDLTHRANVLTFIPDLGSQCLLLVQSGEFERDRDMAFLEGRVAHEYQMVRDGSPTRTRIERYRDGGSE